MSIKSLQSLKIGTRKKRIIQILAIECLILIGILGSCAEFPSNESYVDQNELSQSSQNEDIGATGIPLSSLQPSADMDFSLMQSIKIQFDVVQTSSEPLRTVYVSGDQGFKYVLYKGQIDLNTKPFITVSVPNAIPKLFYRIYSLSGQPVAEGSFMRHNNQFKRSVF
ncbi:MAG: hypothetical protein HQM12_00900 [SAR324 cluster bacterium]|nr:hypothetical protein [SAR324 cluster bacterium]